MSHLEQSRPTTVRLSPLAYTQTFVPGAKESLAGFSKVIWDPGGAVAPKVKELIFICSSIVNLCEN